MADSLLLLLHKWVSLCYCLFKPVGKQTAILVPSRHCLLVLLPGRLLLGVSCLSQLSRLAMRLVAKSMMTVGGWTNLKEIEWTDYEWDWNWQLSVNNFLWLISCRVGIFSTEVYSRDSDLFGRLKALEVWTCCGSSWTPSLSRFNPFFLPLSPLSASLSLLFLLPSLSSFSFPLSPLPPSLSVSQCRSIQWCFSNSSSRCPLLRPLCAVLHPIQTDHHKM